MKVTANALVHPEGSPVSSDPGSASHREHAGSFAKMFQGSLCKSQTTASSSPSSLAATQEAPSDGPSVKVLLSGTAAAKSGTPAPSAPQASVVSPTTKADPTARPAATAADQAGSDARPTTAAGLHPAVPGAAHAPAGQGHPNSLKQGQKSEVLPESHGLAAGRNGVKGRPATTESLLLASEANAIDGDLRDQQNDSAAKDPGTGAAISTSAAAHPIAAERKTASPEPASLPSPTAPSARGPLTENGRTAWDPARTQASQTAWSLPRPAHAQLDSLSAKNEPDLASGTAQGPATPPQITAATAEGARAAHGIARFAAVAGPAPAPTTATPFGGFGTDNPPHLDPRAAHAPLAAPDTATAQGSATPSAVPAATDEAARAAHGIVRFAAVAGPAPTTSFKGYGTDSQPQLAPRALHPPLAAPAPDTDTAPATGHRPPATGYRPSATTTPFGGFGTDSPPHLPPRAAHVPVAATATGHRPPATASSAAEAGAPIASLPAAGPTSSTASPSAQPTQPAGLAHASLPSLAPRVRDESAASKDAPPVLAGQTSHPARPASAAPPSAAPITAPAAAAAADPSALAPTASQAPAEPRERTGVASAGKRMRAQDGTDDPSTEQSPSPPIFVAAHDSTAASLPIHHMREGERAAVPDHSRPLPTSEGKQTGEAPHVSLPDQAASGQTRLHAEAQVTPSTPQAPPQFTLPVHTPAASGPTNAAVADPRLAAHLPAHASALAAQVAQNDGLSMTVMPNAAHMAIESPDGDLDLRMRVQHGSAEITVGGSMAPLFHARAPEARAALASEGLALGNFDSGQPGGGQQGQPAPETPEAPGATPAPYRPHQGVPLPATPTDGRIHVTA